MLPGLLRFEWRYHTRRLTFAVTAVGLALMSMVFVQTGYGPAGIDVNAPYVVMQTLGLLSLLSVFVLTFFCADAALRDDEHDMTGIVFATPVGKPRYLLGRFAGAWLAAFTVLALAALVLMLAPLVLPVEPGRLGPVRPLAYLWALLVLVLPNLLLVGALLFAVASLTRSTLATHVGAVAIYALYLVCALLVDSPLMAGAAPPTPEGLARAALLDPFGLSAFFEQTRYWAPAEREVRLLSLSGHVLLNRLLWLGVAASVLGLVYARFSFQQKNSPVRPAKTTAVQPAPGHPYRPVAPSAGTRAAWQALQWATRLELRHVLRGWTFRALLVLWVFVVGMEATAQLGGGEYGTHLLPTTGLMLDALQLPLLLLGTVVVVYYAAEVVWRESIVGVAPLLDSTPSSNAVFYLAKAAALAVLPLLMAAAAVVVGMAVQLANGYYALEPALYLTVFWFAGVPLVLFGVGALALQVLSPNRWVGMLASLTLAFVVHRGAVLGLEHPMLHFGTGPTGPHSDMDGFGPIGASFGAFMLYWAAAAALLACLSWGLWRRGPGAALVARVRALPQEWGRRGKLTAAASTLLFVGAGVWLYWQSSVVHPWESEAAQATWQADYERAYRPLATRPEPQITAIRAAIALYPAERRADVTGTLMLENQTTARIDTVCVALPQHLTTAAVHMPGARLLRHDARFGVLLFRLHQPLAPAARTELRFRLGLDRSGIRAAGFNYDVTANGTYLTSASILPALGYRAGYELDNPAERRQQGLPPATPPAPLPRTAAALQVVHAAGPQPAWFTLDLTLSTTSDQAALGPGRLVRQWQQGPRRYFHYVQEQPSPAAFSVASARYGVARVQHQQVAVEVWYHPAHAANVARVLAAATRSLEVLGARYGRYPFSSLRIVEVPAWSPFGAFARPGMVFFTEDRGFTSDTRAGDVDLVTRRVAHEVGHQWWGGRLDPADVAGASTLVETLAKHSEQLVLAAMHGPQALPPMLAFDEDRYLAGRAEEETSERTLLETTEQAYLYYGKGAVVMNGLRHLLGEAAVDRALAHLLSQHGGPTGAATTLDLQEALHAQATTPQARALIDEWLAGRTVYDIRVDTASAIALPDGRFRTEVQVSALRSTPVAGEQTSPVQGDVLEVAVLDGPPPSGKVLYSAAHTVQNGRIRFSTTLAHPPAYIIADPYLCRLDRDRSNNQRKVLAP